ncbi:kelch domain-containing protein 8B-like [Dendronephthya gigantea]|uniref:kelch domain-containing protein 8B-like n=1 Tax=Dendronephthya gigantea TaxID=151771 RepID=UPI00106AF975|nr:kelch domain-containing protein 8B-like [Dendronephthya gigantea]
MTKTLADIKERIGNIEKNTADIKADIERKHEAVNNKVDGLKTALVKAFDEIKDVLIMMEAKKGENTRKNMVAITIHAKESLWTSFIYSNHIAIAGGICDESVTVDDMIRMSIYPKPDPSAPWSDCPVKLPDKLIHHNSVLYNDQLLASGGVGKDLIRATQLVPPYSVKTLSRMSEQRQLHSMEIFDDNLLIVGGRTTGRCKDNLSSVVQYDIKKKELKQLSPLPYAVSDMATVRWGDNIVVIGGADSYGMSINMVIIYNVKTGQSHMLPSMRCKRRGCTAVVVGNNIVVLGGYGERREMKSVESFNFERYSWEEFPEMSEARFFHTAVVV